MDALRHIAGIATGTRGLVRVIGEFEPDVILAHCVYNVWSAKAARRTHTPAVALLHELPVLFPSALYGVWTRLLARATDRVIVSSETMRLGIEALGFRSVTVLPGIDPREFHAGVDGSRVRDELLPPGAGPLVVSVSHIMEAKGQVDLVDSLPQIVQWCPRIRVAFVGGTNGRPNNENYLRSLKERVRSMGLESHVLFTGARPDIAPVLAAADLVVYTSHHESFGMVPLEAHAVGVPVVATDVGFARELSKRRRNVHVVSPRSPAQLAAAIRSGLRLERAAEPLDRMWTIQGSVDAIETALAEAAGGKSESRLTRLRSPG
jgi:glycosyltransferase involved in cell wall biosynthesis